MERALKLSDDARRVLIKNLDTATPMVSSTGWLAASLWVLGYPERAREHHAHMLGFLGERIDAFARGVGFEYECQMSYFIGDNRRMLERRIGRLPWPVKAECHTNWASE